MDKKEQNRKNYKTYYYKQKNKFQNYVEIPKISKLLFVEDGSIDVDAIENELLDMGIKVIVYRQGANKPELIDLEEGK